MEFFFSDSQAIFVWNFCVCFNIRIAARMTGVIFLGLFELLGCSKFEICLLFDWFSMYMSSARSFLSDFAAFFPFPFGQFQFFVWILQPNFCVGFSWCLMVKIVVFWWIRWHDKMAKKIAVRKMWSSRRLTPVCRMFFRDICMKFCMQLFQFLALLSDVQPCLIGVIQSYCMNLLLLKLRNLLHENMQQSLAESFISCWSFVVKCFPTLLAWSVHGNFQ